MKENEFLKKDVQYIKGVGPNRARLFSNMGLSTVEDILNYSPFRYEDRRTIRTLNEISEEESTFFLIVTDIRLIRTGRYKILKIRAKDHTGYVNITYFNQEFLKKIFKVGKSYFFYGKLKKDINGLNLNSPDYWVEKNELGILPVYELTKGLNNKLFRKVLKNILHSVENSDFKDYIPDHIIHKYNILEIKKSYEALHFPESFKDLENALYSLKWRELFYLHTAFIIMNREIISKSVINFSKKFFLEEFKKKIPFDLTNDQVKSIEYIENKLEQGFNINILLQGDVGAGKTIVVFYFMLKSYFSGLKSVLMAPTEVLARQHYNNMIELFDNIDIVFLKGGNYKGKKKDKERLSQKGPLMVIGTHALFQKDLQYNNVGLIIIDEQHRFGVNQRMDLIRRTDCRNVVVMSATPIPRTLSLTVYGDMDCTFIKEKPAMRLPVKTYVRSESQLNKIYSFAIKRIRNGERVFVITPLIEESEKLDLKACMNVYEEICELFPSDIKAGILHGKMKDIEKQEVMDKFDSGEINILVSTTVVEVGVDIREATFMIIKNAERFGIAQLHQLRGRVGRGDKQSWCALVHKDKLSKMSLKRLKLLEKSNDGFYLADKDMMLRGSGEIFGKRQHGFGMFRFTDVIQDKDLIETVRRECEAYININKLENISKELLSFIRNKYLKDYSVI